MADETYVIPEEPVYREAVRKILNEDPVNADEILNPLVQALLENIHFVKLLAQAKAESTALDAHTGDNTAHLTAEERTAWNGKAEGGHSHTAADVGALASGDTAAAAAKLATARTIRTNLASTSAVSFNGTANITPGVTGTLPIAHGGTGATTAAAAKAALGVKDPKRTTRFTVGTSTAGWTADRVDYLCDGTADDVEINAAIQALPTTGGEVVILDGTYNLTGPILVNKNNVTLSGNGQSTILKRAFASTSSKPGLIYVTSGYNTIKFLSLDGVKSSYSTSNNNGIYLDSNDSMIIGNTCNSNAGAGIYINTCSNSTIIGNACKGNNLYGIFLETSTNITIIGNMCIECPNISIHISSSSHNTITGNTCIGTGTSRYGIFLIDSAQNTVSGNTCNKHVTGIQLQSNTTYSNTVTGNTCNYNTNSIYLAKTESNSLTGNTSSHNSVGIYIAADSVNNTVTGNMLNLNSYGIYLRGSKNQITGNTATRNGSVFSSSEHTLYIPGDNNLISSNMIYGKNYTVSGTGNTFVNNKYN